MALPTHEDADATTLEISQQNKFLGYLLHLKVEQASINLSSLEFP